MTDQEFHSTLTGEYNEASRDEFHAPRETLRREEQNALAQELTAGGEQTTAEAEREGGQTKKRAQTIRRRALAQAVAAIMTISTVASATGLSLGSSSRHYGDLPQPDNLTQYAPYMREIMDAFETEDKQRIFALLSDEERIRDYDENLLRPYMKALQSYYNDEENGYGYNVDENLSYTNRYDVDISYVVGFDGERMVHGLGGIGADLEISAHMIRFEETPSGEETQYVGMMYWRPNTGRLHDWMRCHVDRYSSGMSVEISRTRALELHPDYEDYIESDEHFIERREDIPANGGTKVEGWIWRDPNVVPDGDGTLDLEAADRVEAIGTFVWVYVTEPNRDEGRWTYVLEDGRLWLDGHWVEVRGGYAELGRDARYDADTQRIQYSYWDGNETRRASVGVTDPRDPFHYVAETCDTGFHY